MDVRRIHDLQAFGSGCSLLYQCGILLRGRVDLRHRLEVENHGVLGATHWTSATRFAWDVAGRKPPDVVLFYDGANEMDFAQQQDDRGRASQQVPPDRQRNEIEEIGEPLHGLITRFDGIERPEGAATVARPEATVDDPEAFGRLVAARYERSRALARSMVDAYAIEAVWVWQPTMATRAPAPGEVEVPTADGIARDRAARSALAADVVDLGGALDPEDGPIYLDAVHTNEQGAEVVAAALYRRVQPLLSVARTEAGS